MSTIKIELNNGEILKVSGGNGKMGNLPSLSTSCLESSFCQKMHSLKENVCSHCYAWKNLKLYSANREMCKNNYNILTSRILEDNETLAIAKALANQKYLRLEAFGELEQGSKGQIQLANYYNIAKALKRYDVIVVLWSKNIATLTSFFETHKMLANFKIILSSYQVNKPLNAKHLPEVLKTCKTFTVVDSTSELASKRNCFGGCNGVTCASCQLCYAKNRMQEIIEMLRA